MGQMEDLRLFTVIVENHSISKAADRLNIAKSAVSRRLHLLEDRYSAKLIDRAPGRWNVTETGRELYQRALRAVHDFEEIETDFSSTHAAISGPLSVSLPREFGISFLKEALMGFIEKYPEIQLTVDFDDQLVDLERDNYDFAIRITPQLNQALVAEKIGIMRHHICASAAYLAKWGKPNNLQALQEHQLLHFGAAKRGRWPLISTATHKTYPIEFTPALNSNSGDFLLHVALQGQGIANLPDFILKDNLQTGALVPILPAFSMPEFFIYLIRSDKRRMNRRMRLFAQEMTLACL